MTTEEKFNAAVNVIRSLPKNGNYLFVIERYGAPLSTKSVFYRSSFALGPRKVEQGGVENTRRLSVCSASRTPN
jgi:hypothetical protein